MTRTVSFLRSLIFPCVSIPASSYSTSGARETIFMKSFSRSSRATGPKMRLPFGLLFASMTTQALSSNRMNVPSGRCSSLWVRTTTAFSIPPFLMAAFGRASFTATTMMSPMRAYLRRVPPRTLMHCTSFAPLLSATFRSVFICIMAVPRLLRLLDDLHQPPALFPAERPGLHHAHRVPDPALVLLVVRLDLLRPSQVLLVQPVELALVDLDDDRLLHLVAHHAALEDLLNLLLLFHLPLPTSSG